MYENLLRSFTSQKIRYWEDYLQNISILVCLIDNNKETKEKIINSISSVLEEIASTTPHFVEHIIDAISHTVLYLGVADLHDSNNRFINAILECSILLPLIEHKYNALYAIINKMSVYITLPTQQKLVHLINSIDHEEERAKMIYCLRSILPNSFCSEYFEYHSDKFSLHEIFMLLAEKRLNYNEKYWARLEEQIRIEDKQRQSKPGYRVYPDALAGAIDSCILLKLLGFNVDIASLSQYAHYSKQLQFLIAPETFDYSCVDTSNYMWQNLIYSTEYQSYFVDHKDEILTDNLKNIIACKVASKDQEKIVYGILLSKDELRSF